MCIEWTRIYSVTWKRIIKMLLLSLVYVSCFFLWLLLLLWKMFTRNNTWEGMVNVHGFWLLKEIKKFSNYLYGYDCVSAYVLHGTFRYYWTILRLCSLCITQKRKSIMKEQKRREERQKENEKEKKRYHNCCWLHWSVCGHFLSLYPCLRLIVGYYHDLWTQFN